MGSSSEETKTQQHQETGPWQPAQGLLQDILGRAQKLSPTLGTTNQETTAFDALRNNATMTPSFAPQATSLANDLINSPDYSGRILAGYGDLSKTLTPYTSPDYLDPTQNPAISAALETVRNDTANNINGMFAGAGRDLSGAHVNTLARGIASAEAPILLGQYNTNVGNQLAAANTLYGANTTTAGALSANDQQRFANRGTGLDIGITGVPQAMNAPAQNTLAVEDMIRSAPYRALGLPSALTLPIAGLGSVGDMSGTTTKTTQANPWQVAIGGALGLAGLGGSLFGGNGMFGANGFFGRR